MPVERDIESPDEVSHSRAASTGAVGVAGPAGELLSFQRRAGNRAVGAMLARQRRALMREPTQTKPASTKITLSFVPSRAMTAREFAVAVWAQFYEISSQEADRRVRAVEEAGRAPGIGPHFSDGVRADEAGKPIKVGWDLPGLSGSEQEDVKGRGKQFERMRASERSAIDREADRRFWSKTGMAPGTKLTLGSSDAANRALWMRTRDEVVRDHNRLESLPPRLKAFLTPGGRTVKPSEYAAVVRIAQKLEGFSEPDWALYQRRVNATADDYGRLEQSIDRFIAKQAEELAVMDRIKGSESLYKQVKAYKARLKTAYTAVGGGAAPIQSPAFAKELEAERQAVEKALAAASFAGVEEFDAACRAYLLLFRRRAVELALLALRASEQVVTAQIERYAKPAEAEALFAQQAKLRESLTKATEAERRAGPTLQQAMAGYYKPTPEQEAAGREGVELRKAAEAERTAQATAHPVLKDPKLKTWSFSVPDAGALAKLLRDDADDRLWDIRTTRTRLYDDPETVFQFERVVATALSELGAGPGSIGAEIVADHVAQIQQDKILLSIGMFVLAIGLGALTFGTGTIAVLGAGGGLVLSAYQAGEEWEHYSAASAAAHTAFDPEHALSKDDPSPVWVALALIGVGFDGAALISALRAAGPAVKVLQETGSAARFEAELAKATKLSQGVKDALVKAQKAEAELDAAIKELGKAWRSAPYRVHMGGIDTEVINKLVAAAYYAAKSKVREFEVFLARIKASKWMKGIDVENLTKAQRDAIEDAFKQGLKKFDEEFAIEIPYASGASRLTVGEKGEMLVEGKAIGATEREEVIRQLGLTHANRGHGAFRDPLTIANEALQNAAKPKGAGMSGMWSSDGAMLRFLKEGSARVAKEGVPSGSKVLLDLPATPDVGRIFIAKSKLPAGVTPLNDLPFASLPDVAELAPTHVRLLFDKVGEDTYVIFDLFPGYK